MCTHKKEIGFTLNKKRLCHTRFAEFCYKWHAIHTYAYSPGEQGGACMPRVHIYIRIRFCECFKVSYNMVDEYINALARRCSSREIINWCT